MTHLRRIPTFRYCVRLWRRSLIIFVLLRGVANQGSAEIARAMGEEQAGLSYPALAVLLAIVGWLVLLSARMRREPPLMQNLGVGSKTVLLISLAPVLGVEWLIRLMA